MVADNAVVQGSFSDLKIVKTRSVVQLIIECPIEQGEQIIAAFGFPKPGAEIPVAVARLDPNVARAAPAPPEKVKRPFHELPLSQQAGIRCEDESFHKYLRHRFPRACEVEHGDPDQIAAVIVRAHCGVDSRSALNANGNARDDWVNLNDDYEQWANLVPEQRG